MSRDVSRVAWGAARRRLGPAMASDVGSVGKRYRVDPGWKRIEDGRAARLDTRTTIGVERPLGRWRDVDPRRPQDEWRAPWKAAGLVVWGSAVGVAWWLGSSKGRGPLSMLRRERAW